MKNKVLDSFDDAIAGIRDGCTVMFMAFVGPGGVPQNLLLALKRLGARELTLVSCTSFSPAGPVREKPGFKSYITPAVLLEPLQIKKVVLTWPLGLGGETSALEEAYRKGIVTDIEIVPLGVLAHRLRAGGSGVGAFYSPIGIGTLHERGKEKRVINGREYLLEYPLRADFGFVRAHKADRMGNLVYRGTARGFNPLIAKAADVTIAEVDEIVEVGELDPEHVVTPGIYIDRIVKIPEEGWR